MFTFTINEFTSHISVPNKAARHSKLTEYPLTCENRIGTGYFYIVSLTVLHESWRFIIHILHLDVHHGNTHGASRTNDVEPIREVNC